MHNQLPLRRVGFFCASFGINVYCERTSIAASLFPSLRPYTIVFRLRNVLRIDPFLRVLLPKYFMHVSSLSCVRYALPISQIMKLLLVQFCQPLIISTLLGSDVLLAPSSQTPSVHVPPSVIHTIKGKLIILCILKLKFLDNSRKDTIF
jgi:hypothetical protein